MSEIYLDKLRNCTFIGFNAGADITEGEGLVIIGDDIRAMPEGAKIVVGKTVFGVPCNLADILRSETAKTQRMLPVK